MLNDILLTAGGDLLVGPDGDIQLTGSIAQAVTIRLRWFLGEWKFNPQLGLPYYGEIFVKNPNFARIKQIITQEILAVSGVIAVSAVVLSIDKEKRLLAIKYSARTEGEEITGEVSANGR